MYQRRYFVSESSVYCLLKAHDLITSPAFILMKAADRFAHPTTAFNQGDNCGSFSASSDRTSNRKSNVGFQVGPGYAVPTMTTARPGG